MALDINSIRFLLAARKRGAKFDRLLTFGRLHLNVYPAKLAQILKEENLQFDPRSVSFLDGEPVAEPFFRALGAKEIVSLDISDYQGATLLHDMNLPIPSQHWNQFDAVFDGGSLEHIFNFPVAIKNCMSLIKPGGHLFIHTVANNCCGHGFYQFSPELFYRIFDESNGFSMVRMVAHMVGPYGRWYEVSDPESIKERVELITYFPVLLLVQAKRTRLAEIFSTAPQQSDFAAWWKDVAEKSTDHRSTARTTSDAKVLKKSLPSLARLLHVIRMGILFYGKQRFGNRRFYKPVSKIENHPNNTDSHNES